MVTHEAQRSLYRAGYELEGANLRDNEPYERYVSDALFLLPLYSIPETQLLLTCCCKYLPSLSLPPSLAHARIYACRHACCLAVACSVEVLASH